MIPSEDIPTSRLTKVFLRLDHLSHNMQLLQQQLGEKPLWPCIKANAYGHGARIFAEHLRQLGYKTFGVADVGEAVELIDAGIDARFIVFSATLPEHSEALVAYGCEPAVCTLEMVEALAREAEKRDRQVSIHIKVDTGMGRIGIYPEQVQAFIEKCGQYPAIRIRGIMSHFARADEADKAFSYQQIETFKAVTDVARRHAVELCHMANSAAILDLPEAGFDAARPGIAIYGLRPSPTMQNPQVDLLKPVLEWKSRITFLKEVPAGTGLSYGHMYKTEQPSLIATVPVGYGDGLSRNLSGRTDFLVGGQRCPQVGRITMDMSLVDVTALRGRVALGDEVVIIGVQNEAEITADELAVKLGTINYEIVTAISKRVTRIDV
jgi:alanine racemase